MKGDESKFITDIIKEILRTRGAIKDQRKRDTIFKKHEKEAITLLGNNYKKMLVMAWDKEQEENNDQEIRTSIDHSKNSYKSIATP
jgi:hypothetical protein